MAAYSMDLRLRVLRDADAGLPSDELAEKYAVSRAWVDRLKQRRRETGEVAPHKQTRWRPRILHAQLTELAALIRERPDRTLAELQEALRTPASLPTLCRTIKRLGFRLKKNGASVIKCCYAATGMYVTAAAALLRGLANTRTSLSHQTTRRRDTKMSRSVSRRVASPACIAGVRVSRPNFSAPCGRTKL